MVAYKTKILPIYDSVPKYFWHHHLVTTCLCHHIPLTSWKNWLLKIGIKTFVGSGLIKAGDKLIREVQERNVKRETVAEVGAHIMWRITRIGVFAFLLGLMPFVLLFQQNRLISSQNDLINHQNQRIDQQTILDSIQTIKLETQNTLFANQNDLFLKQNDKVTEQTELLSEQNNLFNRQNNLVHLQASLLDSQIVLMGTQNDRINIQNNLLEADRRSSLIFLMSNILDLVNDEIRDQQDTYPPKTKYSLSEPLIGRIVALSRAFQPYSKLDGGILVNKLVSPERGQLLVSLMASQLDSATQNRIVKEGDFAFAIIGNYSFPDSVQFADANLSEADLQRTHLKRANLEKADLVGTKLRGADFSDADLKMAKLIGADLRATKLIGTNLSGAGLSGADLILSNLSGANLKETQLNGANLMGADVGGATFNGANLAETKLGSVKNLTFDQLLEAFSMFDCKNLDPSLKTQLEAARPCLFTNEGCQ